MSAPSGKSVHVGASAEAQTAAPGPPHARGKRWRSAALMLALCAAIGGAYLSTLHPGVVDADAAELQFMAPLLGVCHPPGYPFVLLAAKLVASIPLGPSIAWRVNLLSAACATAACVLLTALVRRATGSATAGIVAAGTLAFSSVFWSNALVAEVYAFYALLLTLGLYALVRFAESNRVAWLCASALLMGCCVANRPSEAFVLPAGLVFWVLSRRSAPLTFRRVALGLGLGVLPLAGSVAYVMVREIPDRLYTRDDALRDAILREPSPLDARTFPERLREAAGYALGLKWTTSNGQRTWDDFAWDLDKYAWLLSGRGALEDRFTADDQAHWRERLEQGRGVSIGPLALLLAVAALLFGVRRRLSWVLLGLLCWAGNLAFYLVHSPPDNLDFISPGLIGLSLLAGLGAAGWRAERPASAASRVWTAASLLAPLFLVAVNYASVDRSTPAETERQRKLERVLDLDFPLDSVIIAKYDPAMTLRYQFYIEARRTDLNVLIFRSRWGADELRGLLRHFGAQRRPVFIYGELMPAGVIRPLERRTPRPFAELGFYKAAS
ncbi:MAG: DUF2723 domain-containing protein [Phycisphaerae bacterium]|jgi:hypothetical protein